MMINETLYSLIPVPIVVNTGLVNGKLSIQGNIVENAIQFSFEFTPPHEVSPLLMTIDAAGKQYLYYCTLRSGATVSTPVFHPEFCVGQQFFISKIEPIVQFNQ